MISSPVARALTIAGSDSGGGAGIQADLKAFAALGVHGMSVVTAVTAQNTTGVTAVHAIPPDVVAAQLDAVAGDIGVDAAKTGMLFSADIIAVVAERVKKWKVPLVVDPVMIAKSGAVLLQPEAREALVRLLLPLATVVTPNAHEAAAIIGGPVETLADAERAARRIAELGPDAVVVKGGHLTGDQAVDVLFVGGELHYFRAERVPSMTDHGTGCTFGACIVAGLARGDTLLQAVAQAKRIVTDAVRFGVRVGGGNGPVNPLAGLYREAEKLSILENVEQAVRFLEDHPVLARLCPESQINIAMGLPWPRDVSEVCGVPGRISCAGGRLKTSGCPAYGGSRHIARAIIAAGGTAPHIRAAMNITVNDRIVKACAELGLVISSYDRRDEPAQIKQKEGSSTLWGAEEAIRKAGRVPDVFYHLGDFGKEPMMVILAPTALEAAQCALKIAEAIAAM